MNSERILKWIIIIGGIIEVVLGILLMFLHPFLENSGFRTIPIFIQLAGTLLFCFGILLIITSRDIERYVAILLVNILLRVIMIVFAILNLSDYPEFFLMTLFAISYDILWSIIVLVLLKKGKYIFK